MTFFLSILSTIKGIIIFASSLSRVRIQALIQLLNMNVNCAAEEDFESVHNKERNSSTSTGTTFSEESPIPDLQLNQDLLPNLSEPRWALFESSGESGEISQKMSQRAICWIMTVCWSKNVSDECLWTTLLLFYLFKSQGKVKKENLQLFLLTCLMISTKLASSRPLSAKDVTSLSAKQLSRAAVIELEGELLQSVNYDIIINHYLSQLHRCPFISPQNINKLEFICELLMVKNCKVFFDKEKLQVLIRMVEGEDVSFQGEAIRKQIKEMLVFKESQIIIKKFESKFDVGAFTCLFL